MSFLNSIPIIGDLLKKTGEIVDQVVIDKDKAIELKTKLSMQIATLNLQLGISSKWRPIAATASILTTLLIILVYTYSILFSPELDAERLGLVFMVIKLLIGFDGLFLTVYGGARTLEKILGSIDVNKIIDIAKKAKIKNNNGGKK